MQVPASIQEIAQAGLLRMQADPLHNFDWRTRRQIYKLFTPLSNPVVRKARSYLAILAAEHVRPIFSSRFPERDLPQRLIDTARSVSDGILDEGDPQVLDVEDEGYHATGGYIAYDDKIQMVIHNADYAAFATYKALIEILHMPDPWQHIGNLRKIRSQYLVGGEVDPSFWTPGSEFMDEDWAGLAGAGDTAAAAAMAFATTEDSAMPQPDKLEAFWIWWANVALPGSWEVG
jgi:hypothetical protein